MSPTDTDKPIAASGTFTFGSHTVHRLGYGAMQLTGPGIWGPPRDHDEAIARAAPRRRARRRLHRHRRLVRARTSARSSSARRCTPTPSDLRHRHQGGADPNRARRVAAGGPPGVPAPAVRDEPASPRPRAHRPLPAAPHRPQGARRGAVRRSSRSCRTRARSTTSACPRCRSPTSRPLARSLPVGHRAEPLQPRQPPVARRCWTHCEAEGIGFIPWFPLASGKLVEPGGAAGRGGRGRGRDAGQVALGVAAAPLARDAADPRHVVGGPPRGELRGGHGHAVRRPVRHPRRRRLTRCVSRRSRRAGRRGRSGGGGRRPAAP